MRTCRESCRRYSTVRPLLGLGIEMPLVGVPAMPATRSCQRLSLAASRRSRQTPTKPRARFSVTMAQPRRLTGSFRFTVEDAARLVGMEDALRANLSGVLSDALDAIRQSTAARAATARSTAVGDPGQPHGAGNGRGGFRALCSGGSFAR